MTLSKNAKCLLQFMLNRGTVPLAELERRFPDVDNIKKELMLINNAIAPQNLKLLSKMCEVSCREVVVLVNTKKDNLVKEAVPVKDAELFHTILGEILGSDECKVPTNSCLNFSSTLQNKMSMSDAQDALNRWQSDGYFSVVEGDVRFGPRTVHEFYAYLKEQRPDCFCTLCNELAFTTRNCSECAKKYHKLCINRYIETQGKCPACDAIWPLDRNYSASDNPSGSSQSSSI